MNIQKYPILATFDNIAPSLNVSQKFQKNTGSIKHFRKVFSPIHSKASRRKHFFFALKVKKSSFLIFEGLVMVEDVSLKFQKKSGISFLPVPIKIHRKI